MPEIVLSTLKKVGNIADKNLAKLDDTMAILERKLVQAVSDATITQTVDIALARAQIEAIMVESGIYERIGELLNDEYKAVMNEAYEMYQEMYPNSFQQFSGDSLAQLDNLKTLDLSKMYQINTKLSTEITSGIINYQYGALSRQAIIDSIAKKVGQTAAAMKTEFDTALFGYYQSSANALALDNGFEKFVYDGPDDKITRDVCSEFLRDYGINGEPLTVDEINALDNGQGLPVFTYGGGYNCRHSWVAVRSNE